MALAATGLLAVLLWATPSAPFWLAASAPTRGLCMAGLCALGLLVYAATLRLAGLRLAELRAPEPRA